MGDAGLSGDATQAVGPSFSIEPGIGDGAAGVPPEGPRGGADA